MKTFGLISFKITTEARGMAKILTVDSSFAKLESGKHISINKFQLKGGHMRITTFCLILIASLSWSILPSWAQLDEKTPRTKADKEIQSMTDPGSPLQPGLAEYTIGPLCQMGGGMMGGGGPCGGPYGPGAGMGPEPQAPPRALNQNSGAGLFAAYCAGCHPGGGNNIMPDLPIVGSEELEDFDTFHSYMRSPTLPNGAHGPMPGFSSSQISTRQMRTLYRFLKSVYGD
jgi:mono/diheme cytochrome c family protein